MNRYGKTFAILKAAGIDEEGRKQLVANFTDNRTASLSELTDTELRELNRLIQGIAASGKRPADVLRKKVIWVLCSMQRLYIKRTDETFVFTEDGKPNSRPNMHAIYQIVRRLGYAKKGLNDYSLTELPKLVTQFEKIRANCWRAEANACVMDLLIDMSYEKSEA